MRFASLLCLFAALTACQRGTQNKDAVRQGVMDYLAGRPNLSMSGMTIEVTDVKFNDKQAEASVQFTPKGGPAGGGMTMRYTLEQKDGKWTVLGRADSGQHSGAAPGGAMPGANPHGAGGAMPPPAGAAPGGIDTERPPAATGKK